MYTVGTVLCTVCFDLLIRERGRQTVAPTNFFCTHYSSRIYWISPLPPCKLHVKGAITKPTVYTMREYYLSCRALSKI